MNTHTQTTLLQFSNLVSLLSGAHIKVVAVVVAVAVAKCSRHSFYRMIYWCNLVVQWQHQQQQQLLH